MIFFHSEDLFNGTFNPASKTKFPIGIAVEKMKAEFLKNLLTSNELERMKSTWKIEFYDFDKIPSHHTKEASFVGDMVLMNLLENLVFKNFEHNLEIDDNGNSRLKPLPGLKSGLRCESVFRYK
jgi:hypothetical protein